MLWHSASPIYLCLSYTSSTPNSCSYQRCHLFRSHAPGSEPHLIPMRTDVLVSLAAFHIHILIIILIFAPLPVLSANTGSVKLFFFFFFMTMLSSEWCNFCLSWQHWQFQIWYKWHVRCIHQDVISQTKMHLLLRVGSRKSYLRESTHVTHVWLWVEPKTLLKPLRLFFLKHCLTLHFSSASFPTSVPSSLPPSFPHSDNIHFRDRQQQQYHALPSTKYSSVLLYLPNCSFHLTFCITFGSPDDSFPYMPADTEMGVGRKHQAQRHY